LRGRIQTALKNFQAAVSDTDKAIQLQPKNSSSYAARAGCRLLMDDFENARADLETALRLNPTNASAFVARGYLDIKRGDDTAALADFQRAVELRPEAPETHGALGMLQYRVSQWEPALTNCHLALKLGATTMVAGYNGCVWLIRAQSGEEQAANDELQEYLTSLDISKTNDWSAITARFLSGKLSETNFLALATTAAKRQCAVIDQVCDSFYYAAMKRKLAGDRAGAQQLLQKCRDTKANNNTTYWNAEVEMRRLSGL
jgi:tetratricopeptide (TPR) repeat protein